MPHGRCKGDHLVPHIVVTYLALDQTFGWLVIKVYSLGTVPILLCCVTTQARRTASQVTPCHGRSRVSTYLEIGSRHQRVQSGSAAAPRHQHIAPSSWIPLVMRW